MGLTLSSTWQVNEAKSRFSELLERAQREGPQTVTRHGKPVAQVVAMAAEQRRPSADETSFGEWLLNAPKLEDFELPHRSQRAPEASSGTDVRSALAKWRGKGVAGATTEEIMRDSRGDDWNQA